MANEQEDESPAVRGIRRELERWRSTFVPAETTIDGGLFPTRFGKGLVGLDYEHFRLAKTQAEIVPQTEELCALYQQLFGYDPRNYK